MQELFALKCTGGPGEIVTGLCGLSRAERRLGWMWSAQEGFLEEGASELRLEVG